MFKKHNWIRYGRQGNIIKIEIEESDGCRIDNFQTNNQEDYARIIKLIKDKYGFSPTIEPKNSPNFDKEKNWLKSEKEDFKF